MSMNRRAVVVTHVAFLNQGTIVNEAVDQLERSGFDVEVIDNSRAPEFACEHQQVSADTEIVVVLGGDGTMLRAAELVHCTDVPILGVNLGHVGFLAEFERFQIAQAIDRLARKDYTIEERMEAHVDVWLPHSTRALSDWALNDISIGHADRGTMIDVSISVDDVEMSSFGCDGVIASTPTGSTAYAFSAGGPIIWPGVKAMQLIPLAAHALFARPLIIGDTSTFGITILEESSSDGWICCDGRRQRSIPKGTTIEVRVSHDILRLARLSGVPFTQRLVTKFDLPVVGWRGSHAVPFHKPQSSSKQKELLKLQVCEDQQVSVTKQSSNVHDVPLSSCNNNQSSLHGADPQRSRNDHQSGHTNDTHLGIMNEHQSRLHADIHSRASNAHQASLHRSVGTDSANDSQTNRHHDSHTSGKGA